jgi:galactoside O-acetyltransferase
MAFASSISGGGQCFIDDFVGVGAGVRLITGTEEIDGEGLTNPTIPSTFRSARRGQIKIEAHAVIFTNSIILPDVVIGQGVVVAAGSLVHHNLRLGVYAGNPWYSWVRPKAHVLRLPVAAHSEEELS